MSASHYGDFSCYGAQALGTRVSVVVVHGFNCSAACGFLPEPWIEFTFPALAGELLSNGPPENSSP